MNKYPLIEILVFFSRYEWLKKPLWRPEYVKHVGRVRSRYTKNEGGVYRSYFNVETKQSEIVNLVFNHEDLLWSLEHPDQFSGLRIDRMLAHMKRHKHLASKAHRIEPLRFEISPITQQRTTEKALIDRLYPFRFILGKNTPYQVKQIETKYLQNVMTTKHLHYVAETTESRFFNLVFIQDQMDWRLLQEVDEQFLFVR
ncbi:MAG: hypothetical protein ABJR05_11120 [Balneola sp.]